MSDPQTDLILSLRETVRAQIEIVEVLRGEVVKLNRRVTELEDTVKALCPTGIYSETGVFRGK